MHMTRRAPELSATSRLVCIWIMCVDPYAWAAPPFGNTSHVFSFHVGAHSMMRTASPVLWTLASSWAWYFLDRRTVFFSTGCRKVRSTFTTTVLSPLSETTTPSRIRFGICRCSSGLSLLAAQDRLDARDILAHLIHAVGLLDLAGRLLEAQVELLFLQVDQRLGKLVGRQPADFIDLHHACSAAASIRATMRVFTGSLAAPRRRASRATSSGTPSISNMIRPGWTRGAQYSTPPLPLPIRTSAGLSVTGTSGKMRIHTRPWRFIWRVIARRAASIWRAVMRSGSTDFRP